MQANPVRGELQLDDAQPGWYPGKKNAPKLAGLVAPGETRWALPPLDRARVEKIRGRNLLVLGFEEIEHGRRSVTTYRQAWWCRVVVEGGTVVDDELIELVASLLDRIKRQRRKPPSDQPAVHLVPA